jgi:PAS domain S-box-containing protein
MTTPRATRGAKATKAASATKSTKKPQTNLRTRAERAVKAQPALKSEGGRDRLLHELQVHQVELQMQNESLRQSNTELAQLNARYHDLYDFAPVAYMTVGTDRKLVELNLAAARLLGRERGVLPGKRLADFVHATSHVAFERLLARTFTSNDLVEEALVMQARGGQPVYVKAQARRFESLDDAAPLARLVLVDLTALKSANDELANALERFFRYWRP